MIDLEERYLAEVIRILRERLLDCEVRAFGSRVRGKARKYSDLDLAVIGKERLDWRRLEAVRDAFAESDLPIQVDVLDWNAVSDEFRAAIAGHSELVRLA